MEHLLRSYLTSVVEHSENIEDLDELDEQVAAAELYEELTGSNAFLKALASVRERMAG